MSDSVIEAAHILNLNGNASIDEINKKYKTLLFKWHPDHCKENPEESRHMTRKIIDSYKIIMAYCYNYKISFLKEDIDKTSVSGDPEEFWHRKFGHDPLWGYSK